MPDPVFQSALNELHPPGLYYITEFVHAANLHEAASSLCLLRNRQTQQHYPGMDDGLLKQRAAMIELSERLLINSRNSALDKFCASWCKLRNITP